MDAKDSACEQRSTGVGAMFVLQHATSLTVAPPVAWLRLPCDAGAETAVAKLDSL